MSAFYLEFPPVLSITGVNDKCLGHPIDVKNFLDEINGPTLEFKVIGKKTGFKNNYDHINLLTHPQAPEDHFLMVLEWLKKHEKVPD